MNAPPINDFDLALHAASLTVGTLFLRSFAQDKEEGLAFESQRTTEIMESYRNLRRHISVNPDSGKRYGATVANEIMKAGYLGIHDEEKEAQAD
tara:strand:+ start:1064 stop:1345 length:282 start_codon:yes stop_codon:yes gene_type:complete